MQIIGIRKKIITIVQKSRSCFNKTINNNSWIKKKHSSS